MKRLPERPDLGQLKKQAKDLLARHRDGDPTAHARLRAALPAAAGRDDTVIAGMPLRLHDAQSCIAREHGFPSWTELKRFVAARAAEPADRTSTVLRWLRLVYAGDVAGGMDRASPAAAARLLAEHPGLAQNDPYLACAVGDEAALRAATAGDPGWIDRPGGPLRLPPLVAVTHSSLVRLPEFRHRLHGAVRFLLRAGADPNQAVGNRWPPASVDEPSATERLSALYGAAGQNHDAVMTHLLLDAGADPNDGESLYHAVDSLDCTRLLLDAGARIAGTNALYRALDVDDIAVLQALLDHATRRGEPVMGGMPGSRWSSPLLWAIRRRRSPAHIAALLAAGADPGAMTADGTGAYTLARRFGLPVVAELLRRAGPAATLPVEEQFVAACAEGDAATARRLQAERPDLPGTLAEGQLRLLPELAAQGCGEAVRLMAGLGWPIATRGGDWEASALNHAVFRGDAALARFLLEHGASWREEHGFGDNACGTLSWASCNTPVEGGDWLGCAEALVAHGMPGATPDPAGSDGIIVDGRRKWFSDEVAEFLLRAQPPG